MGYPVNYNPAVANAYQTTPSFAQPDATRVSQPSFAGSAAQVGYAPQYAQEEKKSIFTLPNLLIAAGVTVAAIAGKRTYDLNKALKATGDAGKVSLKSAFVQNLNPFTQSVDDMAAKLKGKEYTEVKEGVNRVLKNANGDEVVLNAGKAYNKATGEVDDVANKFLSESVDDAAKGAGAAANADDAVDKNAKAVLEAKQKLKNQLKNNAPIEITDDVRKTLLEIQQRNKNKLEKLQEFQKTLITNDPKWTKIEQCKNSLFQENAKINVYLGDQKITPMVNLPPTKTEQELVIDEIKKSRSASNSTVNSSSTKTEQELVIDEIKKSRSPNTVTSFEQNYERIFRSKN